jgi:hypothetical protein
MPLSPRDQVHVSVVLIESLPYIKVYPTNGWNLDEVWDNQPERHRTIVVVELDVGLKDGKLQHEGIVLAIRSKTS